MVSKRLGLLIATTGYTDSQLPAVPDGSIHINDLADVLRSSQIGRFSLTVLIDPNVETARSAIASLLTGRDPDDIVLLYFVGHCIRQTADFLFLALRETSRLDLENTALPAALVRQQLQETVAKKQIIILDSLLGSVVNGETPIAETPIDRDLPLNLGLNFCVANRHQVVLAASDYLSFCLAGEHYVAVRPAQPPLTASIVQGLRSRAADEKGDRKVTVTALLNYLKDVGSVRKDEMRVAWMSEGAGDLIVAVYPDKAVGQAKERSTGKAVTPVSAPTARSLLIDDNVKFTAYHPAVLAPGKWRRMTVFMHLDEPSTLMEIEARTQQILDVDSYGSVILGEYDESRDVADSRLPTVRENGITLVPEFPGIRFNPPRRSFSWAADLRMHEESFFMRAPFPLSDKSARGRISVFFGQLLLAEIALDLRVANEPSLRKDILTKGMDKRFRKVFASYSNHDVEVVEAMERIQAIGYEYLRKVVSMRSGQQWSERLLAMIADADAFQLFWSRNAAQSVHVTKEWQQAISLQREGFVRPAYWEFPMPEAPDPLRQLRFCFLPRIHTKPDRPKEKEAEEGMPIEDKQISEDRPGMADHPSRRSSASTKSQASSSEKTEETGSRLLPNETLGKSGDLSSKAPSVTPPQKDRTPTASALAPRLTDPAKIQRRRILPAIAILGAVIGGCLLIFSSINTISRTFLGARHPSPHSKAGAPSAMPSAQATPVPTAETPSLTTPTPTPSQIQPLATPAPSPTAEKQSASPSVSPTSTAPEATDSGTPTNRVRHHSHRRSHHRQNPRTKSTP
jgi:TIR domain/Caspase domain